MGSTPKRTINNAVYDTLGARWYEADDDPIALLRAESRLLAPWVVRELAASRPGAGLAVLDLGSGGGFIANQLASAGLRVTGVDLSAASLAVARERDATRSVRYEVGDVARLPFADASFDAVTAMDLLEHVADPARVIAEASRVLRPGGLFFFHTFNKNPVSWLVAIKLVSWVIRNVPPDLHLYGMFRRPGEIVGACGIAGMQLKQMNGVRPKLGRWSIWRGLLQGVVSPDLSFAFSRSTLISYAGYAQKRPP
jgi:2-polyprenyl-6-hydroxyphenyl methylase/3-demethylubiquinone-9 3-methyltransferase